MSSNTARLSLLLIDNDGDDPVTIYRTAINTLGNKLDSAGLWVEGPFSSRPAASIPGRRYYATDTSAEYLDIGTAWVAAPIAAGSVTAAMLATAAQQKLVSNGFSLNNGVTTGLSNTSLAIPASHCQVSLTLAADAIVQVTARATLVKSAGSTQNVLGALFLDGSPILDATGLAAHYIQIAAGGASAPGASLLLNTGNAEPGLGLGQASGTDDYPGVATNAQLLGSPIDLWVPSGTHTLAWAFAVESPGTYTILSQALAARAYGG